jgi:hypothetical protein
LIAAIVDQPHQKVVTAIRKRNQTVRNANVREVFVTRKSFIAQIATFFTSEKNFTKLAAYAPFLR